jgi:hypothetical protein
MISVGFQRVSKKRPCRICGKPTYCGFSKGRRYFHLHAHQCGLPWAIAHGGISTSIPRLHSSRFDNNHDASSQSISLAPLEIREVVFREFLRLSPASNYMEELVTGPRQIPIAMSELYTNEAIGPQGNFNSHAGRCASTSSSVAANHNFTAPQLNTSATGTFASCDVQVRSPGIVIFITVSSSKNYSAC